jgi:hypothetical protein
VSWNSALATVEENAAMPHNDMMSAPMLTVVETSAFARRAEKLLSAEEHEELVFLPCASSAIGR